MRIWRLLPLLALVACGSDPIRLDAERVMQRTTPPRSVTPYLSFARSQAGADAEWSFQLTTSWRDYSAWAVERLTPDFTCRAEAEAVRCYRALDGDGYSLTLAPSRSGDVMSVRAVFAARPR